MEVASGREEALAAQTRSREWTGGRSRRAAASYVLREPAGREAHPAGFVQHQELAKREPSETLPVLDMTQFLSKLSDTWPKASWKDPWGCV